MLRRSRSWMLCAAAGLLSLLSTGLYAQPINTTSRSAVISAYNTVYSVNLAVAPGWSGNASSPTCNAGTTSDAYKDATIGNANFYRGLVGLQPVTRITNTAAVDRAQRAALMMIANQALNHTPPTSWLCYTAAGAEGAGSSNIALGSGTSSAAGQYYNAGPGAINNYIDDSGNQGTLGHRRWILKQSQVGLATGDIVSPTVAGSYKSANALRVFAATGEMSSLYSTSSPATTIWAAWPSPNFVPYPLIPSTGYWSISYPGASFSNAQVTITPNGGSPVTLTQRTDPAFTQTEGSVQLPNGYGDNTLLFKPGSVIAAYGLSKPDASYKVEVTNVTGAATTSFCYTVTIFDPAQTTGPATAPDLCNATALLNQTITFTTNPPSPATVGNTYTVGAQSDSGLTVSIAATGACSNSGNLVTFNATGTCTITATQGGNGTYNAAQPQQQAFSVGKIDQVISLAATPPANTTYGSTYQINAVGGNSLIALAFSVDATSTAGACTVSSTGLVTFTGAGTCRIDINQGGNSSYNAAAQVQVPFTVGKANQTIAFTSTAPASVTVGDPVYVVTALATSGLDVTYTIASASAGVCSLSGTSVSFIAGGTCTVIASQGGSANYNAAPAVQQAITVNKKTQSITFNTQTPSSRPFVPGGSTFQVSPLASTDSGLPVAYSSLTTSVCTIASGTATVTMLTPGTCTIAANQPGNGTYAAAAQVTQNVAIGLASQTLTFPQQTPDSHAFVSGGTFTIAPPATSNGSTQPIVYGSSTTGVCTVSGSTVTMVATGTCTITANQAGDGTTYAAATQVTQNVSIVPATLTAQTLTFPAQTSPINFTTGGTFTISPVTASGGSGNPVAYSSLTTGVCTVSGTTVTMVAPGTCTIAADQAGDGVTFAAATQVTRNVILLAGQTINFPAQTPSSRTFAAGGQFAINPPASATSNLPITYASTNTAVCTVDSGTAMVTMVAPGTCAILATQGGDGITYAAAAPVSQSVTLTAPLTAQTITFLPQTPASRAFVAGGTFPLSPAATTSAAGLTIAYTSLTAGVCTISGTQVTMVATGTCTIAANQPGNGTYAPALQVTRDIVILTPQTITFPAQTSPRTAAAGDTFAISPPATTSATGLTVTYTSLTTGVCTISGTSTVVVQASGTCTIAADQAGNGTYAPATQVTRNITIVAPQNLSLVLAPPANPAVGSNYTLTAASTGSANPIALGIDPSSDPGTCSLNAATSPATITFGPNNGKCIINATQAASPGFAAGSAQWVFNVGLTTGATAVPTLGEWALLLLAAMIGLLGMTLPRRATAATRR